MSAKKRKKPRKTAARRGVHVRHPKKPAARAGATSRADFLARAWAMEVEAAERYATFADAMEAHNNLEVAELFRKLARIEQLHADQLLEEDLAHQSPVLPPAGIRWDEGEGPETASSGELHYRMQPYHALQIALECEKRANKFFADFAYCATDANVRKAAREMAAEEAEHVALIEDWLKRIPPPEDDWMHDPDPPVVFD